MGDLDIGHDSEIEAHVSDAYAHTQNYEGNVYV